MNQKDFTTSILVSATPRDAFSAICNVRGWWSQEVEGGTHNPGDEFSYHYKDVHRCKMRLTEVVPEQRVVWQVLENYFSFTKGPDEWAGTKVSFEISAKDGMTAVHFTHQGLFPEYECYNVCSGAWTRYITESLRDLILTGKGAPNPKEN